MTRLDGNLRKSDARGRIALGRECRDETYAIVREANGDIILSPVVAMHEREAWLYANPEALASLRRGLEQAAAGDLHDLGSFAAYADEDERSGCFPDPSPSRVR